MDMELELELDLELDLELGLNLMPGVVQRMMASVSLRHVRPMASACKCKCCQCAAEN